MIAPDYTTYLVSRLKYEVRFRNIALSSTDKQTKEAFIARLAMYDREHDIRAQNIIYVIKNESYIRSIEVDLAMTFHDLIKQLENVHYSMFRGVRDFYAPAELDSTYLPTRPYHGVSNDMSLVEAGITYGGIIYCN